MNVELNLVVVVLWLTAVVALGVAVYAWRRREMGEWAKSFSVLSLAVALWTFNYGFEVAATELITKLFWAKTAYLWIVTVSIAWFVFGMQYTGRGQLLTKRRIAALFILPAITIIMVFTNDWHGLHWSTVTLDETGPILVLDVERNFWFWIHSAYSYTLIIVGTILLVQAFSRYPKAYRRQNATLVVGATLPLIANALFISGILPLPSVDLTTLTFAISGVLMGNAIFRYQLFDIVPVARRTAVDNMRDGMIVLDTQNRIVDINPAALKLFQQDSSNMIGRNMGDFLQNQPAIIESFRNVSEAETEVTVKIDDKPHYFELHISPLDSHQNGKINGRLIVFYDITARKETEKALAKARDEALEASLFKSELLARVSHELRTPLNVILGYTEMLQEGIFDPISESQWEPTNRILESTSFLSRQVNELLDLSKLEVGEISLNYSEFSLSSLMDRIHNKMDILAKGKGMKIDVEIHKNVPDALRGDQDRIEQIVLNLVGNAIKFSEEGAVQIEVCLPDEAHWSIKVSDEGMGIPETSQSTIFEPFKQVDGSITRLHSGTGLGLAIVKQLTELMDGEIILESQVDVGSSFTVVLPLLPYQAGEVQ